MSDKMLTAETVQVIHRDKSGAPDYIINLTLNYCQESGQWVGVCEELGTSTYDDSFEQMKVELREAVELQLNGVERITDVWDYLADRQVIVRSVESSQQVGFAIV